MDETQKKELEVIMNNAFLSAMDKADFSFVSLIKYSRQNNLFFDKFYESHFVVKLSKLKLVEAIYFLDHHESYGLSKKQVSSLFSAYAVEGLKIFLSETRLQFDRSNAYRILAAKVILVLDKKLFFENDFFNQSVFEFLDEPTLKSLNQKNTSNFEKNLEFELKPELGSNKEFPRQVKL